MEKYIKIVERPNTAILKLIEEVEKATREGYHYEGDMSKVHVSTNPALVEIAFPMVLLEVVPHVNIEKISNPAEQEEPEDYGISGSLLEEGSLQLDETASEKLLACLEDVQKPADDTVTTQFDPSVAIGILQETKKHKDLKQRANEWGLEIKKHLKNPNALRNDLIKQVENV